MDLREAIILERRILRDKPERKPQARKIGNGEWIVKLLSNPTIVWDEEDWDVNFVGRSVQPEEQEEQVMV